MAPLFVVYVGIYVCMHVWAVYTCVVYAGICTCKQRPKKDVRWSDVSLTGLFSSGTWGLSWPPAHRPGEAGVWLGFVFKWALRSELVSSCLCSNRSYPSSPGSHGSAARLWQLSSVRSVWHHGCQDWMNNAISNTEHYLGLKLFCFLFSTCLLYIPNTKIHFHQFWWNFEIRFSTQAHSSVSHCPCYDTGTQRSEFVSIALAWLSVASACAPQIIFLPVVFLGKLLALHSFPLLFWLAFLSSWWMPLGQFIWSLWEMLYFKREAVNLVSEM